MNIDKALNIMYLNILFRLYMFLLMFDKFYLENNKYIYELIYNRKFLLYITRYFFKRKKSIDIFINFTIVD